MKVQIKDLNPNPFRDMDNYPIEEDKIQALVNSINETGFWDNIVARKNGEGYQIAYGHHRLMALQRIFPETHVIDIPVKDFDDSTMLRIMANENDATWGINVRVDDETVKAAKRFLDEHAEVARKYRSSPVGDDAPHSIGQETISRFLGKNWHKNRVARSLQRNKMEEEGKLSREAINMLPTEGTSRSFVAAVKEIEPDLETQIQVAKRISDSDKKDGLTNPTAIRSELLKDSLEKKGIKKKAEQKKKAKDFIEYIRETNKVINDLNLRLDKIAQFQSDFDSEFYRKTQERMQFSLMANSLFARLKNMLNGGQND